MNRIVLCMLLVISCSQQIKECKCEKQQIDAGTKVAKNEEQTIVYADFVENNRCVYYIENGIMLKKFMTTMVKQYPNLTLYSFDGSYGAIEDVEYYMLGYETKNGKSALKECPYSVKLGY